MTRTMFIGLVTHPRSRFPDATGPDGLQSALTTSLGDLGWQISIGVVEENRIESTDLSLTRRAVWASLRAESDLEKRWARFQQRSSWRPSAFPPRLARLGYQSWNMLGPGRAHFERGIQRLIRLANIEAAHLDLMSEGVASNAEWTTILEDDAYSPRPAQLSRALDQHLRSWTAKTTPSYINISESFSRDRLGLAPGSGGVSVWDERSVVQVSQVPFTNTVCAIIYRRSFLEKLFQVLKDIPMEPVVPIDWKINNALMRLSADGEVGPGDCYSIEPGPIVQGSIHPNHDLDE